MVWRYSHDDDEDNHEEAKRNKLSISAHGRMMHGNDDRRRNAETITDMDSCSGSEAATAVASARKALELAVKSLKDQKDR